MALFALAVIIFIGQRYVLAFVGMIASPFLPPGSGFYETLFQSYYVVYAVLVSLVIAGVALFYKGSREGNDLASPASAKRE